MEMRGRATRLAAFFGSILAGFAFTAISEAAIQEKDCLAAPDGKPALGSRWYYRSDPATKRHCWYVRGGSEEVAQLAASSIQPAALQQSDVDARAEISPAPEIIQPRSANGPSTLIAAANIANGDFARGGTLGPSTPSRALLNGRAEAAPSTMVAGRHRPQPASARQVAHPAPRSVSMLLSALAGALALVGITTAVVARIGRRIAMQRRKNRSRSRKIWSARPREATSSTVRSSSPPVRSSAPPVRSSAPAVRSSPPPVPTYDEAPMDWIRTAREAQEAHRQSEQIEELLSRVARRSAV
jgi:hypothetical protein